MSIFSTVKPISAIRKAVCLLGIVSSLGFTTITPALADIPRPDLVIGTTISYSNTCVAKVTIKNQGMATANVPFWVRFSRQNPTQSWLRSSSATLAAGQTTTLSSSFSVAPANGNGYYLVVTVDAPTTGFPEGVINESDEDNNIRRFWVNPHCGA